MKQKVVNGNEICAYISYLFSEISGIYPITPATEMAEFMDKYSNNKRKNILNDTVKIVEMQSEKGAIALVHGALQTGSLATTFTSSQGLLLMLPSMYKIAGEMLPCVINVASRTVATHALSIFGDHSDIYAVRSSGFSFLASSNVQDVMYMTLISHLSAIKSSMPFVNFFDGFRTSHEINKINVLDDNDIKQLIDFKAIEDFKRSSIISNKKIKGTNQNDDIYFQNLETRNKIYDELPDIVNSEMKKINKKCNTDYHPFNYYGKKDATKVIVAMGSVCDTIRTLIDTVDEKLGLIEVHLFRPFSSKYFLDILPKSVKKIAVLDRAKESGASGEPLYLDVVNIISKLNKKILVLGGRYGISSKNTTLSDIYAVYKNLDEENINSFTIGINDDVTNKSLKVEEKFSEKQKNIEMLIYGYGSDGMISASKNLIKLVGENTKGFVQGYFRYDSKKSGGLTISNLRIGKEPINLPYYVDNPHIVVCTNDYYLNNYDILKNIRKNGIFILVTNKDISELPDKIKYILKEKNIKFYTIDAYSISTNNNIPRKISMIVEAAIIAITKVLPYELGIQKIKEYIKNKFSLKGEDIVINNIKALEEVKDKIKEEKVKDEWNKLIIKEEKYTNIYDKINHLDGYSISVNDLMNHKDGSFDLFKSNMEQLNTSDVLPSWKSDTCIECNKCSIVCPHGVIVPKILTNDDIKKNKNVVYEDLIGKDGYKFALEFNYEKCTGCGICASTCVGKRGMKALEMLDSKVVKRINEKIESKAINLFDQSSIKGIGFNEPLFRFPSACKGCGETPYLKLLTQMFKDGIIFANATGCSSIYGGNINTPYNTPWSNSLFEDNAEYGFGMYYTVKMMREKIERLMSENLDRVKSKNKALFKKWLDNKSNYEVTKEIMDEIDYDEVPELLPLKNFIETKSIWLVGGDGWSYDIDFDGIDHIMSSNENVNILVLNTEVYSNTGGQTSKATEKGAIAKFSIDGKKTTKKDLAKMMMGYENVYIAHISLGANMLQTIKAIKEAEKFDGPSLIIAYSPCINHGIKEGMNSMEEEKLAVQSGYFPLFRYNGELTLDYTEPDFNLIEKFINKESRFNLLNDEEHIELLKSDVIKRFNYYKSLIKK